MKKMAAVGAMVKAGHTIFVAGPADIVDEESSFKTYDETPTREELKHQSELFLGKEGSVLLAVSAEAAAERKKSSLMCCRPSTAW